MAKNNRYKYQVERLSDDVKQTNYTLSCCSKVPRLMSDDHRPVPLFKSQFFMRMENFQGNCRESAGNYYRIRIQRVCGSRKCFYCDFIPDKPSPVLFLFEAHTKYFFPSHFASFIIWLICEESVVCVCVWILLKKKKRMKNLYITPTACASMRWTRRKLHSYSRITWPENEIRNILYFFLFLMLPFLRLSLPPRTLCMLRCVYVPFSPFPHLSFLLFFSSLIFFFKTDFSSTFFLCTHFSNNIFSYSFHLLLSLGPVSYRKIFIVHFIMLSLCITLRGGMGVIGRYFEMSSKHIKSVEEVCYEKIYSNRPTDEHHPITIFSNFFFFFISIRHIRPLERDFRN